MSSADVQLPDGAMPYGDTELTAPPVASTGSPSITIILTNYNHARYLECSLGAIVNQTRPADEIIVIDDGSTDDSLEIIEAFKRTCATLRVLRNERNRGVQYSIARALGAATSDWVVWAAADDKLLPDFVRRGVEMIERFPDVGVVFSELATFRDGDGEEVRYGDHSNAGSAFYINGDLPAAFDPTALMTRLERGYLWLSGNTAIARREALLDVGGFIPRLEWHSDWFAFFAVALRYGACGIPETLAMMRVVPETYSSTGMKDRKRQRRVMYATLDTLRRPEFHDLRQKFRARPCLFSAFPKPMLDALLRRPRDWDILLRLACWALDHRHTVLRNRLTQVKWPRGMRTRIKKRFYGLAYRVLAPLTPSSWTHG
ncbi:glycosyltransferase family 2 protein [Aurantimonas sp. MSK8Z-1]|uniref:glycosyltransferase family 2 protein n=1 Tax=Mangrovibrevibacter kandeliae TaxID=2968473 RepID=UPI0022313AA6|nr:glycosyltransferase family A protein [Aurantimonas sp. MSK8Z-1]MCW4117003.1 glycosyltransferase family 2 protein [Aurantimonas sp. MSK8Z-1]